MMPKKTKIWLIAAGALVLLGCVIFVGVMAALQWDFTKLSTVRQETNTYAFEEDFEDFLIVTDTADIRILPANEEKCTVICEESENAKHTVQLEDGTLTIRLQKEKAWKDYIGINFTTPKVTVYLPREQYGDLVIQGSTCDVEISRDFCFASVDISVSTGDVKNFADVSKKLTIKTSTGDVCVENITVGSLDLKVTTGKVTASGVSCKGDLNLTVSTGKAALADIQCANMTSTGNTGDLTLRNVIAAGGFSIERSTGSVRFEGCDAAQITVETDTGSVTGSLLSDKIFITKTGTGKVDVPKTADGGKCEITTSTGNIRITVE